MNRLASSCPDSISRSWVWGSAFRLVCFVFCVCWWGLSICVSSASSCPASSAWRGSILTLTSQGPSLKRSDHHLCLFSLSTLRDKCKCSSNLDSHKPGLLLLIYLSPFALHSLLSSSPSSSLVGLASLFLPAHFHPTLSVRDVNRSDSRGHWNDRISLSAGSLVTFASPLWHL